jgi:signal transduction protein with GAF and PtsI domain
MSASNLARVKIVIRTFSQQQARHLLDEALGMEDGIEVYRLLSGALEEVGVYGY